MEKAEERKKTGFHEKDDGMKKRTGKKEVNWQKLDNTANLFPVIANETMTNVYRISLTLSEKVDGNLLQEALLRVLPWFDTMNVRMRTGMFWYYFETNTKGKPVVKEEDDFPCRLIEPHRNRNYLFQVTYHDNRINLEVFHVLADGTGAINFLRELTYQYLRLVHLEISGQTGDVLSDDTSLDTEDSYLTNYKKSTKKGYKAVPAVHLKGEKLRRGELGVIHGRLSLTEVKKRAKERNMSINEYLCGMYVYGIYRGYLHENPSAKPIVLCVPVNLRPFFSSMTTRNFFAMVSVPFFPKKERYDCEEVLGIVQQELKKQITRENLVKLISYNVSNQKNLVLRAVPLFLKKPAIKLVYLNGTKGTTTTVTNMGNFMVKDIYRPYIRRCQIILPPSQGQNMKGTISSFGDELTFTISSLLKDTSVPREFFRALVKDGLSVNIETNGVYYE